MTFTILAIIFLAIYLAGVGSMFLIFNYMGVAFDRDAIGAIVTWPISMPIGVGMYLYIGYKKKKKDSVKVDKKMLRLKKQMIRGLD